MVSCMFILVADQCKQLLCLCAACALLQCRMHSSKVEIVVPSAAATATAALREEFLIGAAVGKCGKECVSSRRLRCCRLWLRRRLPWRLLLRGCLYRMTQLCRRRAAGGLRLGQPAHVATHDFGHMFQDLCSQCTVWVNRKCLLQKGCWRHSVVTGNIKKPAASPAGGARWGRRTVPLGRDRAGCSWLRHRDRAPVVLSTPLASVLPWLLVWLRVPRR